MQHVSVSLLPRQIGRTALSASRQSSNRLATKSHVRFASSSSSSSSSTASTLIPYAAGAAALGLVGYTMSSKGGNDASKRKNYVQRMVIEEKKEKEAKAAEEEKEQPSEATMAKGNDEQDDKSAISTATNDLAEQASQESAFDPETNTINWDCPCLGGMADGPCGEEFKKAFSCFVFSEQEPKGIDCVEHFKAMQDCFRKYPEQYKEELEDEEDLQRQEDVEESGPSRKSNSAPQNEQEDDDEGIREWRREMGKEA